MKDSAFITRWVTDTIKEKYSGDIALAVSHTTLLIDGSEPTVSYFVPITERGYELARTFIYKGIGYDIWAIPWERLERFAALEEYNLTVLADGELLYAKDGEWAERFEALKEKQRSNLADEAISREKALKAYAQAKGLFLEMQFSEESDSRMLAGYTADYLAQAIAFSDHMYFRRSQTAQLDELRSAGVMPEGFDDAYLGIIAESGDNRQLMCRKAIRIVSEYLEKRYPEDTVIENNLQDLSDWYAELSYTWLRLRTYAASGDKVKVYMWGIVLQRELDDVCGDFGIEKPELMSYFDWNDTGTFIRRADELERMIRERIISGGGVIREYASEEDFLNENS